MVVAYDNSHVKLISPQKFTNAGAVGNNLN